MDNITGKQFGPYQVIEPLGEGGMAAVYKGYQPGIDRYVALKVLPRRLAEDPQFVGRFHQEAQILAQLQHPHILPVFDYGQSEGYTYIVMPYIQGGTLVDLIQQKPIPLQEIPTIISQIASGLDYAHNKHLIHRDVKPSNILIDESGNCLLTDFGIAKIFSTATRFTSTGGIIGTPEYMSPEQGQGKKLDRRSDIYSLGIVLYELVTGQVPFQAETPIATVMKHIYDPLPPPRQINHALSEPVEKVLLRALAKEPADRFPMAGDMAAALQAAIDQGGTLPTLIDTAPVSRPSTEETTIVEEKIRSRNWLFPLLAVVLLFILCAASSIFVYTRLLNPVALPTTDDLLEGSAQSPPIEPSAMTAQNPQNSDGESIIAGLSTATHTPIPTEEPTFVASPTPVATATMTPSPMPPLNRSIEVIVDGTTARTETGINVQPGQRLTIEYLSGSWRAGPPSIWPLVGPEGDTQVLNKATFPVPDSPIMTLVGGIGTSLPAAFGNQLEYISNSEGTLWLGPNDDGLDDNQGQLIVRVTISE